MSDRDTTHLLEELQHARSLADSHERAFRQANARYVELMDEVEKLRDLLRWRDVETEKPTKNGYYIVFKDAVLLNRVIVEVDYWEESAGWDHSSRNWQYWRPIGELPKVGSELHRYLKQIIPELYRRPDGMM